MVNASRPLLLSMTDGVTLGSARAIRTAAVLFVTVLTAAAAQVSFPLPLTPVPLTLQPMVVLLAGAALGARLGLASQVLYLIAGLAGMPVFAASPLLAQGAARLLGPTGGFLIAYPLAAFATGWLAERGFDRRYLTSVLAMAAGLVIIFASGLSWLTLQLSPVAGANSFQAALQAGVYPFLPGDVVKLFVAGAVLPGVWKIIGR
ncbi:MAG: biotin transporter BioY [Acidobacteria bacterium]|nr:biotin transporter BioY [Acidobacteriota bacterium]